MNSQENKDVLEIDERPYLDFYKRHNISPVSQDISDTVKHFSRRRNLHRYLGLIPSSFKDKRVIEFGPGSGHNAIYVNSLGPAKYVLVDANPVGLNTARALLAKYAGENTNYEFVESLIEDYESKTPFDVVICEGVIPYQLDSAKFLKHIATFVAKEGVLIVTGMDRVGTLSEILRQVIRILVVKPEHTIDEKLAVLRPIFKPHLDTLINMSRPLDDWILDCVIQPITGNLMSMQQAIRALDDAFDIYGSSPRILTDWRWYKDIYRGNEHFNKNAIDVINRNVHNLIDYRYTFEPQPLETNLKLIDYCDQVFDLLRELENNQGDDVLEKLNKVLESLAAIVGVFSPQTALSIEDFMAAVECYIKEKRFPDLHAFAPFFGRGQVYMSFTRRIL